MTPYIPDNSPSAKEREEIELNRSAESNRFESEFRKKHPGWFTLFGEGEESSDENNSSSNGTNTNGVTYGEGDYPIPLTKEVLLNYAKKSCPNCNDGQLQNKAGDVFENLFED